MKREQNCPSRSILVGMAFFALSGCGDHDAPPPPILIDLGQPPTHPESAPAPDGPRTTFALSKVRLGGNDLQGKTDFLVWKTMGYNLDHKVSPRSSEAYSRQSCKLLSGSVPADLADGDEGRDNAFGKYLMSLVVTMAPNAERDTNEMVLLGQHTILLDVLQLGQSPTYENMHVRLYEGRSFVNTNGAPATPQWNGTDVWPVATESVVDGTLDSPISETLDAYIADEGDGGTLVGRFGGTISFYIAMYPLKDEHGVAHLRIHHPLVTMRFSADRRRVESGVIAGFLNAEEITDEAARMMGAFDTKYCGSNTEQTVRIQTRLQSDILLDGQLDMTRTCDSLSIGLEFEAERAEIGTITAPAPPQWEPCAAP